MDHTEYESPLNTRYASKEMSENFSRMKKYIMWQKLLCHLVEAEKALGLPITEDQVEELNRNIGKISCESACSRGETEHYVSDFLVKQEDEIKHHIHSFSLHCGSAASIIQQQASTDFVADNSDMVIYKCALDILLPKLAKCIDRLSKFAEKNKSLPTLGYTHFQAAQLTTVGKRACLWLSDLLADLIDMEELRDSLTLMGTKKTTTEANFVKLFDGNYTKVEQLDEVVADKLGFKKTVKPYAVPIEHKQVTAIASCLSILSASVHKICTDIRLLAHEKEIEEPFEKTQIGSSAMAYKRNPMRSERCCSLARIPIANHEQMLRVADKNIARMLLPQSFLCVDGILNILQNIVSNLVVYDNVIKRHISEELPFMATEEIIMEMVKAGGNRQVCHEEIRVLSQEAAKSVKLEGKNNDLINRIRASTYFKPIHHKLDDLLDAQRFIGCCVQQVEGFLEKEVSPALDHYRDQLEGQVELHV